MVSLPVMDRPIGMFDSGFGGLTVARALIDLLPDELGPIVGGMMDHAAPFMKKALEAA